MEVLQSPPWNATTYLFLGTVNFKDLPAELFQLMQKYLFIYLQKLCQIIFKALELFKSPQYNP
jgi:ABC-type anion transport system duplicated permease subunit